jgi:hypothetical protein
MWRRVVRNQVIFCFLLTGCEGKLMNFHEVLINDNFKYIRHDYHHEPEEVKGSLLSLVFDIPYLGACGVFPPSLTYNQANFQVLLNPCP